MRILLSVFLLSVLACSDDDAALDSGTRRDVPSEDVFAADVGPDLDSGIDSGASDSGGDDAGSDAGTDAGNDAGPDSGDGVCGAGRPVASVADLVALAPVSYGTERVPARRPTSGELVATSVIRVSASDFAIPSNCVGFCTTTWLTNGVPTIERDGDSLNIPAGTRFQVRFAVAEIPPLGPMATVLIQRSCSEDCRDFEDRCSEDDACYGAGADLCQFCLGGEAQSCACVDRMQMRQPNGTMCHYILGDLGMSGLCEEGICRREI